MEGSRPVKPGSSACLWLGLVSVAVAFLCTEARTTPSPLLTPSNATCAGNSKCKAGIILPIWYPEDPSMGDKIARVIVYFVAMIYMFLGVSIIADRFMAAIEVITSQERELVIKRPNGETTTTTIRVWNETVSNLTLMALGSSAPEIMLSVIEVCGHGFKSGELGPATIVGSAAFNMFVIVGICVSVIPQGEVRKVKHLRVFFITAGWSIFAYIWLYMILAVFSPNEVQVWEGLLTLAFFPICVLLAWVADRRLLFYKFMHKKYRTDKHRGVIIESEAERAKGIEMDGKMVNSHFMDGGVASNLIGLIESKEVDESRRDMIRILKDLKQKHPEKEMDQLVEMANYYALSHQQKSRAFYRIQATRMMTGAGNILKKHVAEQAKKSISVQEVHVEEPEEYMSRIAFDPSVYQCLENCGAAILTVTRKGGDINQTIYVDYKTEDGSANAGADYEFSEGTVVFKPGEMFKEINIGIIDDDIFEEDEHFFVRLGNLRVLETEDEVLSPNSLPYPKALLGFPTVATVTILDDDHSGIFTFESSSVHVSESMGIMEVKVIRTSGARGTIIVPFRTVEGLAKGGGEDFEDTYGELEFKNDETWLKRASRHDVIDMYELIIDDDVMCFCAPITVQYRHMMTSLSADTFASKVSAVQDTYADASIGNVTGSNAVNVFLGIGLAWSVAAIYWHTKGKPFVVEAGSLAFSITLFTIFAFLAISVLLYRRRAHIGGELGGPRGHRLATSAFLFGLWFLYILFSSLEAYCHIQGF
ncbi:sodium/calcium exchanger 3 [Cottoperca gobio]|uniref:Sodium/calcium exchanger 3 n=1 Tax=Cottoperca gobio TaxID=56716 RepID=A0A6J2S5M3_COTGO|nr:sodium/calcium exchanger 3-like [Cottoperca gobio]